MAETKPLIVLSTDTLPGYGLDHIFDIAKTLGFDGIDLAMWKNFDARNTKYVKKLIDQYGLPVYVVQTSPDVTAKELQQAMMLAQDVGAKVISCNAPGYFNIKSFDIEIYLTGEKDATGTRNTPHYSDCKRSTA